MGRPALLLLLLPAAFAAIPGHRADAHVIVNGPHVTYFVHYDAGLEVRTDEVPRSAIKANGGPLTFKQRQALRDTGRPGYRADLSDLIGAQFVTMYLEEPDAETGPGGKLLARHYPPIYCIVTFQRSRQWKLNLTQVAPGPSRSYLIGYGEEAPGIHLPPKVKVKTILVHSYFPRLTRLPPLR